MDQLFLKVKKINLKRIMVVFVMLSVIFLLAGGIPALYSYVHNGEPITFRAYRENTLAPLFGGCIMMGAFGLMWTYKNRNSPTCLIGFVIVGVCYWIMGFLYEAL